MTGAAIVQVLAYLIVLTVLAWPLGRYMARALEGEPTWLSPLLGPLERGVCRACRIRRSNEMDWRRYTAAFLALSLASTLVLYLLQRAQGWLPFNPGGFPAPAPHLAFNTAVSFATNTNWQSYGGESTFGYLVPLLGLTVQNFVSAAAGIAVLLALVRGIVRRHAATLGNFWLDLVRATVHVLLPLSAVLALALVSQGVVQTLGGFETVPLLQPVTDGQGTDGQGTDGQGTDAQGTDAQGAVIDRQILPLGPVASQVAIKQLGTNGGGYFNTNSAHPFENPTALSSLLEMLAILLIPAALCFSFGRFVQDDRQGWALYAAMLLLLVGFMGLALWSETRPSPVLASAGADQAASDLQPGGNMEGKEARFGTVQSALWSTLTTAASNGSVNSMHDSFGPLGGLAPMALMAIGEVAFGGVGSGLYGMLMFVLLTVFIAGLMVGRTPEYLGKKVEAFETKMATLAILVPALVVLIGTAVTLKTPAGLASLSNPGAHGLSQVLYAFTSAGNNNGSAFAGFNANVPLHDTLLGLAMLFGRFFVAIPVLAIAGSLARKTLVPAGPGTLPTHGPLFVVLLISIVLLVGALTFVPAWALGPVAEHLQLAAAP